MSNAGGGIAAASADCACEAETILRGLIWFRGRAEAAHRPPRELNTTVAELGLRTFSLILAGFCRE
jgi:hypothetical protein